MAHMSEDTEPAGRRLLRRGSVFTLANALKIGAAALAIPIATRLLDPSDYGTVTLATTLQLMLATVVPLGLPEAILRFYYDEHHGETGARALIASSASWRSSSPRVAGLVLVAARARRRRHRAAAVGLRARAAHGRLRGLHGPVARPGAHRGVRLRRSDRERRRPGPRGRGRDSGAGARDLPGRRDGRRRSGTFAGLVLTGAIRARPAARATLRAALTYGCRRSPTRPRSSRWRSPTASWSPRSTGRPPSASTRSRSPSASWESSWSSPSSWPGCR